MSTTQEHIRFAKINMCAYLTDTNIASIVSLLGFIFFSWRRFGT